MILRKYRLFIRSQAGFTLLEILAALAISAFIGVAVTMANVQILNQTSENNNYTACSRNTLNALHWIGRDAQGAQIMEGMAGFPEADDLVLSWTEWDNTHHQIVYSVVNGQLLRNYSTDGGASSEMLVAEYINPSSALTNCTSDNGVLILTITASVGEGNSAVSVTKVREITSRANL